MAVHNLLQHTFSLITPQEHVTSEHGSRVVMNRKYLKADGDTNILLKQDRNAFVFMQLLAVKLYTLYLQSVLVIHWFPPCIIEKYRICQISSNQITT